MRDHQPGTNRVSATSQPSHGSRASEVQNELGRHWPREAMHDGHGARSREGRFPVVVRGDVVETETGTSDAPVHATPRKRRGPWLVLAAVLVIGSGVAVHH